MPWPLNLAAHFIKEEQVLFPRLHNLQPGESAAVLAPIRRLMEDHDDVELLQLARLLTNDYQPPSGACRRKNELAETTTRAQ